MSHVHLTIATEKQQVLNIPSMYLHSSPKLSGMQIVSFLRCVILLCIACLASHIVS
jgi:hypothetical protein